MICENRNVFDAIAERRQRDAHDVQSIVQILAKMLALDRLARIAIRRRDEANVDDRVMLLAADAANHTVLNDAQQLRLQRQRHLRELVQEERSAVRHLEQTDLVAIGAGERALPMAEHLRLEQLLRHRRAVDRNEAAGRRVGCAGAGTARCSSLPVPLSPTIMTDASVDATLRARSTARRNDGDAPSSVILSLLPLRSSRLSRAESSSRRATHRVRGTAEQHLEMRAGERLRDIVPRTDAQRLDARGNARVAGHHHDDGVRAHFERRLENLDAGHRRHAQIDKHDVERRTTNHLDGFVSATRHRDAVAFDLQEAGAPFPQRAVVVD